MKEKELIKTWQGLDTRVSTLNDRTKRQTIQISELNKRIKELEKNFTTNKLQ